MKKSAFLASVLGLSMFVACSGGGSTEQKEEAVTTEAAPATEEVVQKEVTPSDDYMSDKGIGPVTSITLGETIDQGMVKKGEELYNQMCTACHKPDVKFIGPAQKGILNRRSPEWVMNMILNPQEMLEKNEYAKNLLKEYNNVPMTNQGLTEEQARDIVEYFRTL